VHEQGSVGFTGICRALNATTQRYILCAQHADKITTLTPSLSNPATLFNEIMASSQKRPSSEAMAIPTKPAEERPLKRTKSLAVRLLDRSTGRTEPLSVLHNQCLADHAVWAGEGSPLQSAMESFLRAVSSMHKHAALVLQADRHPDSVARVPRHFDEETYVWRIHHQQRDGRDGSYVAAGCLCSWCAPPALA